MNGLQDGSAKGARAFRSILVIALAAFSVAADAAPSEKLPQDRNGPAALRHSGPVVNIPEPNQRVTVSLPVITLDNQVPAETVLIQPILTTNLDFNRRYVGFQGDFTFDPNIVNFSPPYVESAGLTADGWSVLANVLNGPGTSKTLRVSGFSFNLTPLSGSGVLYNMRMLRVAGAPGAITSLDWRLYPNGFLFFDDQLAEINPDQLDGLVTITGIGPTATPSPVPVPTPCAPLLQGFDNIYTLVQDYWVFRNNSEPLGDTIWFQGESTVFPPQSGGTDSYISANFLNGAGTSTISNWLLTPPLELHEGAQLSFYTRTVAVRTQPDRLQVRMSTNGSSFDVGTTATSVGDFGTLLLDINPNYTMTGYPNIWTQYTVVISGLGSRTIGRLAFRYFVENGGPGGDNSNLIGLDSLRYSSCGEAAPTPSPAPPTPTPGALCPPVITQSVSEDIIQGNSVACIGFPPFLDHFDNSYWRAFDMGPITAGAAYYVNSVSFGVEVARASELVGTQPIIVRLYRQTSGEFPGGERAQIAMTQIDLPDQTGTIVTVPLSATVPAGTTQLIMEVFTPDGQPPIDNSFFIGSNSAGQSGLSYLSTQRCEYPTPIDLGLLGFPDMHLVFNINGSCTAPSPTPSPTPSIARLLNLSTRMRVETGDRVGVAGFIISGGGKRVLLRGLGPSLGLVGVTYPLADPVLELRGLGGGVLMTNNNWRDTQEAAIVATGLAPGNDLESAIVVSLDPGAYTAILKGNGGGEGTGLVEIYDLEPANSSRLVNLSTRAFVGSGENVAVAGLLLGGGVTSNVVLLRGLGPSLSGGGITDVLANPMLELRNSDGVMVASNNDWQDGPPVSAPPNDLLESAIEMMLSPGSYTALLSGVNNGTGVGLVEVYDRGVPNP
jgi:hypothetical protein